MGETSCGVLFRVGRWVGDSKNAMDGPRVRHRRKEKRKKAAEGRGKSQNDNKGSKEERDGTGENRWSRRRKCSPAIVVTTTVAGIRAVVAPRWRVIRVVRIIRIGNAVVEVTDDLSSVLSQRVDGPLHLQKPQNQHRSHSETKNKNVRGQRTGAGKSRHRQP